MTIISKEQIINLHKQLIDETGGANGLRDEGLLDSAYNAPFQRFDNQELFPTIQQKSARLAFGLINNHPFRVLSIRIEKKVNYFYEVTTSD